MDKFTEIVAHMIGIFHTTLEDERMRDAYDKFEASKAADPDLSDPETVAPRFDARHDLKDFTPGFSYAPPTSDNDKSGVEGSAPSYFGPYAPVQILPSAFVVAPQVSSSTISIMSQAGGRAQPTLEPPASVAVITHQSALLFDDDVLRIGGSGVAFTAASVFHEELAQYQQIATAIAQPVAHDMIPLGEGTLTASIALHDHIATVEGTGLSGVSTSVVHGAETLGVHVNGALAQEMPQLADLMPAFHAPPQDDAPAAPETDSDPAAQDGAAQSGTSGLPAGVAQSDPDHEWPDPFEGLGGGGDHAPLIEIEDGHAVVVGANTLINQVSITSAWLDAPVISVMGDMVNLDIVSQINVMADRDSGHLGGVAASVSVNGASLIFESSAPAPDPDAEEGEAEDDTGLPSNWAVTRIEGDLLSVNHVTQYSFTSDHDSAEISFGSAATYIGMGDNSVINITDLAELGYGYDLIICGGNMISLNWISQVNVLIDNDAMSYGGASPAGLGGGDNLVFNGAMINGVGLDGYREMQDNFAKAAEGLAEGGTALGGGVARDSLFEGVETLRVLYIEGDFLTLNRIDQTNILGDSDQVHLALENFEATTGAQATVTAGSNALVNLAAINEFGVDSTIMVGGEVYDDALLYQAELIDTDAAPTGVDLPALASEAVAFLADDMLTPDPGEADGAIVATAAESNASSDIMQTMLA